ncbi:MAG: hypothetical protein HUK05_07705, partial [Prevotella sp.]|nr:hypothetical protein [Prevotella sp.]
SQKTDIECLYGLAVNPETKDFYLMDAKNYVSSGELLHFKADGTFDFRVWTGDIPSVAAFVTDASTDTDDDGKEDDDANSPYIYEVLEYVPAPGQYINTMPKADENDTPLTMTQKCTQALANNKGDAVCLGSFGGYITFRFAHAVQNKEGAADFIIYGNAFDGSAEPGIVMVAQDKNGNGLPDDDWYELSGSADTDSIGKVIYGYSITYQRNPMGNIPWTDSRGQSGFIMRNSFQRQEYYPLWLPDNLTFSGTLLPNNAKETSGKGNNWVLSSLRYGYADNQPNSNKVANSFDIDWAVDNHRKPVKLQSVDFIRVYSALNQQCGWIGETSTEITGAEIISVLTK